jgi:hypothetical protein
VLLKVVTGMAISHQARALEINPNTSRMLVIGKGDGFADEGTLLNVFIKTYNPNLKREQNR